MAIPVIAITAVLELIKYVMTAKGLINKSPEEVLELWSATAEDSREAINAWRASRSQSPE